MTQTLTRPVMTAPVFTTRRELEQIVAEAREAYEEAERASCRTTVEEGYTMDQWQAARDQAEAAHNYYLAVWGGLDLLIANELAALKSAELDAWAESREGYGVDEIQTVDGIMSLSAAADDDEIQF